MFYISTVNFLPPILEPTLNELVCLKTREDPWPLTTSSESSATSTCPRRIGMKDIEQPDGSLQGGPHVSLSAFDEPKFCKTDTKLWHYWSASLNSTPGLAFPSLKEDKPTVDPWDVSFHQEPPFYRRLCTEPPYESGMADKFASIPIVYLSDKNPQTPSPPDYQIGNPKTSPGSHSTSPLHSHL